MFVLLDVDIDPVSELTAGTVICGNPSRALRTRKKANQPDIIEEVLTARLFAEVCLVVSYFK